MEPSKDCIELIKRFEGLRLDAYLCPAGVLTIGYGHTKGVRPGDRINALQAELFLQDDLNAVGRLLALFDLTLSQGQYDALVSLIFNIGIGNFMKSTLLKKLQAGEYAGDEFPKWNKSGGKVLPGLVKRRQAEKELFDKV